MKLMIACFLAWVAVVAIVILGKSICQAIYEAMQ